MSRVVERLFLTVPRGCLQFVIVVFPDHTHLLFLVSLLKKSFHSKNASGSSTLLLYFILHKFIILALIMLYNLGLVARKPVFQVSDKASLKPFSSATENS